MWALLLINYLFHFISLLNFALTFFFRFNFGRPNYFFLFVFSKLFWVVSYLLLFLFFVFNSHGGETGLHLQLAQAEAFGGEIFQGFSFVFGLFTFYLSYVHPTYYRNDLKWVIECPNFFFDNYIFTSLVLVGSNEYIMNNFF